MLLGKIRIVRTLVPNTERSSWKGQQRENRQIGLAKITKVSLNATLSNEQENQYIHSKIIRKIMERNNYA